MLLLFAAVVMIDALVGEQGLLAERRARRTQQALAASLARTEDENRLRQEEIERLENDPAAIEDAARRDLNFIKPGEKVFILKDLPSPAQ